MAIDLNAFLEALSNEKVVVKKEAAKAVLNYRKTRDPYSWNESLKRIVALGISERRLNKYFLNY